MEDNKKTKKAVLLYGRFPEYFSDGSRPDEIPECDPNNEKNWMGWTKKALEQQGFLVICPIIPKVWQAPYEEWRKAIDKTNVDENTTLVGLSQGAGAVARYVAESNKKIKKLILVAPARHIPDEAWTGFYDFKIGSDVKKRIIKGTTAFFDTADWDFILDSVKVYEKELDAKAVNLPGRGHFSFEIPTLPELLDEILTAHGG